MERITDFARGNIRVRVKCRYPERFVNICAAGGVEFRDMEREGDEIVFTTHRQDYKYIRNRAKTGEYNVIGVRKTGATFFLWRLRKRYFLLGGMAVCLGLLLFSSLFIWELTVTGNETVPSSVILANLRELGVDIGTFRLTLDEDYISNEMLLRVPELCWLTVNTHGSRAEVKVREEIPAPEVVEADVPSQIFAKKAGIIEKMNIYDGKKLAAVGDTVSAGDLLVTGEMDSLSRGTRYVHAMGEVWARTWYTRAAMMSDTVAVKEYTGRTKRQYSLTLCDRQFNLFLTAGTGWSHYDKVSEKHRLSVMGVVLPVSMTVDTYSEYELSETRPEGLEEGLENRLISEIESEIDRGEIVHTEFETSKNGGVITVTLNAECREQIGEIKRMAVGEKNEDNT